MRYHQFLIAALLPLYANAQPPVTLEWSAIQPINDVYGGVPRIGILDDTTFWMVVDGYDYTNQGNIRRYLSDGTRLEGLYPYGSVGCGSLNRPIDFTVRNDSLWGLSFYNPFGWPEEGLYCLQSPGGEYLPESDQNGDLWDGAYDLLVSNSACYMSTWRAFAQGEVDNRVVALDLSNNVMWETVMDSSQSSYAIRRTLADRGDTVVVAAFPEVYWLDAGTGAVLGSTTVYSGGEGAGQVLWNGTEFLWAAYADDLLRFGKLDAQAVPVWSNSVAGSTVKAIAQDAQGRLWIGGSTGSVGSLTRISSSGIVEGTWPQNHSVTDLLFQNGRLFWTGYLLGDERTAYLIAGTPQP